MKERARQGSFERAGLRGRRGEPRCRIVKRAYGRTLRYNERARLCCKVGGVCAEGRLEKGNLRIRRGGNTRLDSSGKIYKYRQDKSAESEERAPNGKF